MQPNVKSDLIDHKRILFIAAKEDEPYFHRFNSLVSGSKVLVYTGEITTATDIELKAKGAKVDAIITTREDYLKKLLPSGREKKAKISNYAGSMIPPITDDGPEILILNPLKQLMTVPYGEWLAKRFLSKILEPWKWRKTSEFKWSWVKTNEDYSNALGYLNNSFLISVDIETKPPCFITSVSYCGFNVDGTSHSFVFNIDSLEAVSWMRELNNLPQPKVMQNGKYDAAHFFAYSAPIINYIADTKNAMHAWFAELPKDLAFLTAMLIRDTMYWKDLGASDDPLEQLKYNALDTYGTGEAFLTWLAEAPDWAKKNYIIKFRMVPAFHMCEMRGIKRDIKQLQIFADEADEKLAKKLRSIQTMVGNNKYNPSSSQQTTRLLHCLGHSERDPKTGKLVPPSSSNEKFLDKYKTEHPLSARIIESILEYRGERKLRSTYLTTGETAKEFKQRILYGLHPDGTDTGRAASREHHFWCGLQIQNIPNSEEGKVVKQSLVADEGFVFFECDYSQAEARGVAYCSGDEALLEAVESENDFHSLNASAFFGIPYHEIYQNPIAEYIDATTGEFIPATPGKTLDKPLRDLSKRVNHGANYNMGARVLLDTMGLIYVIKAQKILDLPKRWTPLEVCQYLLNQYERTYPKVKTRYYQWITRQVMTSKKLVGATGWTRYCFGNPAKNKLDLNSYVAHVTQSLNAMILDEAFLRVFKWQMAENNWHLLQQFAEIHDSDLGQVRIGHEHLAHKVKDIMTFGVEITDCDGVTREMIVPVDVKLTGKRWGGEIE